MLLNYVSDNRGVPIAVQIPIADWHRIKNKYPDVDDTGTEMPEWQKELIDTRLALIKENPASVRTIDGLIEELDKTED